MALPKTCARVAFAPEECEFIAADELIQITPTHKMGLLHFLHGSYGPFRPPIKARVPLWLAVALKKAQRCDIHPPPWLDPGYLGEKVLIENTKDEFCELPFHFLEIAYILFEVAPDNITDVTACHKLISDLREARGAKARAGLALVDPYHLQVNNLTFMEINELSPFFTRAFDESRRLTPAGAGTDWWSHEGASQM